jgi:hypothetical protein
MKNNIFVFDVESTSLFGTGFAVGAIVMNEWTQEIDRFELLSEEGMAMANDWVRENVIPSLKDIPTCKTDLELRNKFYDFYLKYKNTCEIWSDCNFPVETNFLGLVALDDFENRQWMMPYPLKDVSTIVDINIDRMAECGVTELRKHNPLDDSIASGVILLKHLKIK